MGGWLAARVRVDLFKYVFCHRQNYMEACRDPKINSFVEVGNWACASVQDDHRLSELSVVPHENEILGDLSVVIEVPCIHVYSALHRPCNEFAARWGHTGNVHQSGKWHILQEPVRTTQTPRRFFLVAQKLVMLT